MPDCRIPRLLLVGCGHMGGAMLRGWQAQGMKADITIADPAYTGEMAHVAYHSDLPTRYHADIVIIAVPPQIAERVINGLHTRLHDESLVISIMAGKSYDWLCDKLHDHPYIARAMPNMPAAIGQGVCGYFAPHIFEKQTQQLEDLLSAIGHVVAVHTEDHINVVTAVSGSGPAYAFLLIHAMAEAAHALGLPQDTARVLATHTVAGAGQYARQSNDSAETLVAHIAVAGGTTEAAIAYLRQDRQFESLMQQAITLAAERAHALATPAD